MNSYRLVVVNNIEASIGIGACSTLKQSYYEHFSH